MKDYTVKMIFTYPLSGSQTIEYVTISAKSSWEAHKEANYKYSPDFCEVIK